MSMPFYVAPEQMMKDRADYARKGIARGRSLVAVACSDGILLVAENPSRTLFKIGEIYDRVAFAGAGRYNEFDSLRIAGVRHADIKGYQFSRDDVEARSLANAYAQMLGQIFTHEMKPLEVEILVAEVGTDPAGDRLFHILYDGTVVDESRFTVLGGDSETLAARLRDSLAGDTDVRSAIAVAVTALAGPDRTLSSDRLEVATLERGAPRRCFRRWTESELNDVLANGAADVAPNGAADSPTEPGPEPAVEPAAEPGGSSVEPHAS